jgi:hypothetical protein
MNLSSTIKITASIPRPNSGHIRIRPSPNWKTSSTAREPIKDVLLDSDTTVATVSALYGHGEANPSPPSYAAEARELARMIGPKNKRMLMHGTVSPLDPKGNGIASMEMQAKEFGINAWKLYPQWGPGGTGFYLDDSRVGIPVIERARELNIKIICAHRGLPLQGHDYKYSLPRDMGPVARSYPDVSFVAYHSGCDLSKPEHPYNPADVDGVNGFITSLTSQTFTEISAPGGESAGSRVRIRLLIFLGSSSNTWARIRSAGERIACGTEVRRIRSRLFGLSRYPRSFRRSMAIRRSPRKCGPKYSG